MSHTSHLRLDATRSRPRLPPGPRGLPLLGQLHELSADHLERFSAHVREHGDTVLLRFGPIRFVLINRPDDIRHVLVKNHKNYSKSRTYEPLSLVLGDGLVTSEGELWRRQRKLMQPAFHRQRLVEFADAMVRCGLEHVDAWDAAARDDGGGAPPVVDIHDEMMRLTFRVVGKTLFSVDLAGESREFGDALTVATHYVSRRTETVLPVPTWLPTPANLRFGRARRALDGLVMRMIAERRAAPEGHTDLMDMLMRATDETGTERMDDRQLRDEVMTLVAAGHETTSNALTWTLMLLGRHPEVERKVHAELTRALDGRAPSFADLESLPYTTQVLQESMRLYPPVWMVERCALGDDQLGEYDIPKGTIVGVCAWTLHRLPTLWDNPEAFDPERFAPARAAARHRYAYVPFAAGPRTCIGNAFAMMEATLLLAVLLQRYRLELVPGQTITPDPGITLRPRGAVRMRLLRRAG
ncbi:MAG: cytochrome P450 [Myxococcales bacterium]|nr:cytochrome P450 [Myxococcales bacterium]MCB9752109.1 cytochrome P450 [Myxococcales bacterium]